jgi:uncharacterized protein with HEPN domain
MSRDPALALDILLAAEDARDFTASLDRDAFGASRLHQAAVIRCLEIMGEAAGRTSPHFRAAHPAIPWRLMSDLRNRLIHGYAPAQRADPRLRRVSTWTPSGAWSPTICRR